MVVVYWCAALILAWGLTWYLKRRDALLSAHDLPNSRSLHSTPVPRTGGVAVVLACCVVFAVALPGLALPPGWQWVAAAALMLAAVGLADDRGDVPARWRLAAQLLAAATILVAGAGRGLSPSGADGLGLPLLWGLATLVGIVWMVNLYNFMDGMDGFAGGMAVIGFSTLALVACLGGHRSFALVSGVIAAASMGFLWFNLPPGRIFMGDAGSTTLGYLAAALSLWGVHDEIFPPWLPLLLFSPFIVDATVTLSRRVVRGERFWEAHRTHWYQRLVTAGWGHARTLQFEYALMVLAAVSSVAALRWTSGALLWLLAAWAAVYAAVGFLVARVERRAR